MFSIYYFDFARRSYSSTEVRKDKLVQQALKEILEAVFEPHFHEEMMGFRPNRNCHMAIHKLNGMIETKFTNYILDADIQSFFNELDHEWII